MRPARWALGGASHSSAQLTLSPAGAQLLSSPTIPSRSVGTSGSKFFQPPQTNALLTAVVPLLRPGIGCSPVAAQLNITSTVIAPGGPWSTDFSVDFGPRAIAPLGSIVTPASANRLLSTVAPTVSRGVKVFSPSAAQLALSPTAPIAFKRAPAAQLLLTTTVPGRSVGRTITPARVDKLLSPTAPRVLPGRLIKPGSNNPLLTLTAPTVTLAQTADFSGLNAWNAHSFTNGEQCLNQGLAYQCITAGVSTIAPTGTGSNIQMGTDGAHFMYLGIAAKTFNVHEALAAWTNHSFTLNERCSNAGNAYQCITSGTSTVAPTGTSADSAPGGTAHFKYLSAIDFTTPQAWADSMRTTFGPFTGGPGLKYHPTVKIWNDGVYTRALNTQMLAYYDIAANGCNTLITAAVGESFRDKTANALAWSASAGVAYDTAAIGTENNTVLVYMNVANVTIDGLQFRNPNPFANGAGTNGNILVAGDTNSTGLTIRNCCLDGYFVVYFSTPNCRIINSLVVDRFSAMPTDGSWPVKWDLSATGAFVCSTRIGQNATGGLGGTAPGLMTLGSAGQVTVRDSAVFGFANPLFCQNNAGSIVVDHCCTNVSTFGAATAGLACTDNGGEQFSKTAANQFVNASTDFHLKALADCIGTGVVDTTNNPVGDDIFGLARGATWDIGADEF